MVFCKFCKLSIGLSPETSYFSCVKCKVTVHLKCVVDKPSLLCDVFYNFTCEKCSESKRISLKRENLTWNCVLTLALYNLKHDSKVTSDRNGYYHWKIHIVTFIDKHWSDFFGVKKRPRRWQSRITGALYQCPALFRSGTEEFGEQGWWQLISSYWPQKIFHDYKTKKICKKDILANTEKSEDNSFLLNLDVNDISFFSSNIENDLNIDSLSSWDMLLPEPLTNTDDSFTLTPNLSDSSCTTPNHLQDKMSSSGDEGDKSEEDSEIEKQPMQGKRRRKMSSSRKAWPWEEKRSEDHVGCLPMSEYEELVLLKRLRYVINKVKPSSVPCHIRRFYRKLAVRKAKRERNLPLFSITDQQNNDATNQCRILDRYKNLLSSQHLQQSSFLVGKQKRNGSSWNKSPYTQRYKVMQDSVKKPLVGTTPNSNSLKWLAEQRNETTTQWNQSIAPYFYFAVWYQTINKYLTTSIQQQCHIELEHYQVLKPYIRVDYETRPPWLQLMDCIRSKKGQSVSSKHPITYSYIEARHIPSVNMLCSLYFWPVDLSECLQYPDFSCVVEYKRLVVGFAFMVPDVTHTEAYISFIFTRPEWRRAGIGRFMLYHLIHTCMGKDVTLHVSATNSALMLYQKFGFKVEEFIQDFYDKYLPYNSKECRHALFLRLSR